ncbi:hypothetical protein CCR97_04125 [Rhodoplanes elegans]|uniref:Uncharacterized protein n=1 Tax=Rhodoplanes elegans TaxID=29408 RepID=A0A327KJ63_9BRAD|nr:hypothetical protein [Rhodoplanes elegans]MBK5957396.1 hypothetical protein [Rhodoplanes elegans]RAI38166.1 hypothetical protein CH338_13690 [Rhodoplanes elegans]
MPHPSFDETEYQAGRRAFHDGVSLRDLAERMAGVDGAEAEAKAMSHALGYADAALDCLRRASGVATNLSGS